MLAFLPSRRALFGGIALMGGAPASSAWNPADLSNVNLSNENRTATMTGSGGVRGAQSRGAGLYQLEMTLAAGSGYFGVASGAAVISADPRDTGATYDSNGNVRVNGVLQDTYASVGVGEKVAVRIDGTNVYFAVSADPTNWRLFALPGASPPYFPFFGGLTAGNSGTLNTGNAAFTIPLSSGYSAWG